MSQSSLNPTSPELLAATAGHTRAHNFGKVAYVHPQRFSSGMYLPSNSGEQLRELISSGTPLKDIHQQPYNDLEKPIVAEYLRHMIDGELFSGGRDYSLRFITGDIGEIRNQVIDGLERTVLVIPQGLRRAQITADSFTQARMTTHPLNNKTEEILAIMAKTMLLSGFEESIYHRLTAGGDATTHGANNNPIINSLVISSTWQFTPVTPYKSPSTPNKILYLSPAPSNESHFAQLKGSGRYLDRILRLLEILDNPQMTERGINDLAYFTPNGTLADTTYTNLALAIPHPKKKDWTIIAFPENSERNYFFQGKTQKTVYEIIKKMGANYNLEAFSYTSPEELSQYIGCRSAFSGKKLMKKILFDSVEAMIAPGTFLGPQLIKSIVSPGLKHSKTFDQSNPSYSAMQTILQLYNNAVWGLNGGLTLENDSCLAANPLYCTMFDVNDMHEGTIQPLQFHHLE